jgi:hypothetical protein
VVKVLAVKAQAVKVPVAKALVEKVLVAPVPVAAAQVLLRLMNPNLRQNLTPDLTIPVQTGLI